MNRNNLQGCWTCNAENCRIYVLFEQKIDTGIQGNILIKKKLV